MRFVQFFFLLVLIYSCSSNKEDVVLNMEDLTPHANRAKLKNKVTQAEIIDVGFSIPSADSSGITVKEVDFMPAPMFPDRFMPDSILKLKLDLKDGQIFYGQWTFSDSLKTRNALFNWLDCFGANCNAIKYLAEIRFQNEAMLLFVNDTSMIYISSKLKLNEKNWQRYLEKKYGIDHWKTIVVQRYGQKALWYAYQKKKGFKTAEFIPLKNQ